jgi:hypothetical protein
VNLSGNKSLPGAAFAQDQDRAIGFGNPAYRTLNARLVRMGGSRLPLSIVDRFSCCHMGTKLHVIVSMQVVNLAAKYAEYASIAGYGLRERVRFLGQRRRRGQNRSLLPKNSVPLTDPESGIHFPLSPEDGFPFEREFMGVFP